MNTIQQISLKIQLGLDPATDIKPELLLEKWQQFSLQRSKARSLLRVGSNSLSNKRSKSPASLIL
jgi:hypothetical protein